MGRPKPLIPSYSVASPKIEISKRDWTRIETTYGHVLPPALRQAIIEETTIWAKFAAIFANGQGISDLKKRIKRIQKQAQGLRAALRNGQPSHSRDFVDLWIDSNLGNVKIVIGLIASLDAACTGALNYLNRAEKNTPPDRFVWNSWVVKLTSILRENGLPTSVRKDSDKQKNDSPSAFVALVCELQNSLAKKYRRSVQSNNALAQAIIRARHSLPGQ
jgi:hypothetical protein